KAPARTASIQPTHDGIANGVPGPPLGNAGPVDGPPLPPLPLAAALSVGIGMVWTPGAATDAATAATASRPPTTSSGTQRRVASEYVGNSAPVCVRGAGRRSRFSAPRPATQPAPIRHPACCR